MKILILNSTLDIAPYYKEHGITLDIHYGTLPGIFPLIKVASKPNEANIVTDFYSPDVMDAIRNLVKPGEYDEVYFVYNPSDYDSRIANTGGYTYGEDVYLATQLATVRRDGYEALYATHEGMHMKTHKIARLNNFIVDEMDNTLVNSTWIPYYKNEQPEAPDGNYAHTWKNMEPFKYLLEIHPPYLKYGMISPWVYDFQLQCLIFGYGLHVDGMFGPQTLAIVRQIQASNNLHVDGIVGPLTLGCLKKK